MSEFDQADQSQVRPASRLIRLKEVQHRVGLSRSTIYKKMADGRFPKSRSLGSKCTVWVEAEIEDWISQII
ncbi:helix-turn-helix transcriptional regulator [Alteraurantiacibacter buctensis]|uniref:helix-turn-helix transcriptional regulator n=1 Tax=Alteraurantiacibacter buctensis TaxID=1503981 RepID=UPI00301C64C0